MSNWETSTYLLYAEERRYPNRDLKDEQLHRPKLRKVTQALVGTKLMHQRKMIASVKLELIHSNYGQSCGRVVQTTNMTYSFHVFAWQTDHKGAWCFFARARWCTSDMGVLSRIWFEYS
jgi:hypothetical protein